MKKNSKIMDTFLRLGLDSLAWSFRRWHCPVDKNALVLEVGSGGNPYFRSNVLIDAYYDTRERHYEKLISDRPTVLGFVEDLPFKDNSFDFVIASHVLEHSKDPARFLSEIQRVSKSGYIEVPDAFFERIACYLDHRLEITDINNELIIRKKKGYIQDHEVYELGQNKISTIFGKIVSRYPFNFNVRYYWSKETGGIKYQIINPEYEFDWESPTTEKKEVKIKSSVATIKTKILDLTRRYLSQTKRNKSVDLFDILMCPVCKKNNTLHADKKKVFCKQCGGEYIILDNNIIKFN